MRVAIITESFPPDVNGVANSVLRCAAHLYERGHPPLVVAPRPSTATRRVPDPLPYPVVRIASVPLPGYPAFRLGLPVRRITAAIRDHGAEVVHLASPFVLGAWGVASARRLGLPVVAVYQTDVAGYAGAYHLGRSEELVWRWLRRVHAGAARTLAPSTSTAATLVAKGFSDVWIWRRGVDGQRFNPARRDERIRRVLAPGGEVIVGYVGRLATEKRVDLLARTARLPGIRLVIVGAGPAEPTLRRALPTAAFVGERHGSQLARLFASLDIFVHTGPLETFCQSIQEAMASGVPVVAPAAGGPLDLVRPGRTGILVPPLDGAALAEAVITLAGDTARRRSYGLAARAEVEQRTWSAIGDELIDHYLAVTGRAASVRLAVPAPVVPHSADVSTPVQPASVQ
jgi:phosphatidylinositol alpha 1,6-mannosyltransferase